MCGIRAEQVLRRATARLEAQRKRSGRSAGAPAPEIYAGLPLVAAIDREPRRTITPDHRRLLADGVDPVPAKIFYFTV